MFNAFAAVPRASTVAAPLISAYTIPQFCGAHNISRTHLYNLFNEGKGPRTMKVGRRTLISTEAAADWRRAMEQATERATAAANDK